MTANYDGVLGIDPKAGTILACCRRMDEGAMRRQFYVSTKGQIMLRRNDDPRKGDPIMCCPYCKRPVRGGEND